MGCIRERLCQEENDSMINTLSEGGIVWVWNKWKLKQAAP